MKSKVLAILFLPFSLTAFARNDMKARMAYEDAEVVYQSGKYSEAIKNLEKVEKLLGKTRYLLMLTLIKEPPYLSVGGTTVG